MNLELTFDGHRVRMVGTPERPEWIARDVCRVLHLHNAAQALVDAGVTVAEKGISRTDTLGGPQDVTTVTEAGLWKLVFRSRKASAQRFKAWLATDVIPCIRQHGQYPAPAALAPREVQLAEAFVLAQQVIAEHAARLAVAEPKAAMLDAIAESEGECPLQDVGRHLGTGPNRTIWQMEEDGVLFRGAHGTLTPRADLVEAGYFRFVVTKPDDTGRTFGQTKVTRRGLVWLAGRYRRQSEAEQALLAVPPDLRRIVPTVPEQLQRGEGH